jgi:hypothetical protein
MSRRSKNPLLDLNYVNYSLFSKIAPQLGGSPYLIGELRYALIFKNYLRASTTRVVTSPFQYLAPQQIPPTSWRNQVSNNHRRMAKRRLLQNRANSRPQIFLYLRLQEQQ